MPIGVLILFIQAILFTIHIVLALVALCALKRARIGGITELLWALLVILVPILGPLAMIIVSPSSLKDIDISQ